MDKQIKLTIEEMLEAKNITRYELAKRTGTRHQIVDKYYKNKVVRYDSEILLKICIALDCGIADIIKITAK